MQKYINMHIIISAQPVTYVSTIEDRSRSGRQVVFNWLDERERYTPIISNVVDKYVL